MIDDLFFRENLNTIRRADNDRKTLPISRQDNKLFLLISVIKPLVSLCLSYFSRLLKKPAGYGNFNLKYIG